MNESFERLLNSDIEANIISDDDESKQALLAVHSEEESDVEKTTRKIY